MDIDDLRDYRQELEYRLQGVRGESARLRNEDGKFYCPRCQAWVLPFFDYMAATGQQGGLAYTDEYGVTSFYANSQISHIEQVRCTQCGSMIKLSQRKVNQNAGKVSSKLTNEWFWARKFEDKWARSEDKWRESPITLFIWRVYYRVIWFVRRFWRKWLAD